MDRKIFVIGCGCGCSKIEITKYPDDDDDDFIGIINYYGSTFYAKQSVIKDRIIERIKMLWFIFRGKDYLLYDLVFNQEEWKRFKEFVANA
jgi:hypothetical protein